MILASGMKRGFSRRGDILGTSACKNVIRARGKGAPDRQSGQKGAYTAQLQYKPANLSGWLFAASA